MSRPIDYGRTVAQTRGWLRMRQAELAEQIGVDPSFISLIETGRRKPSLDTLEAIAKAFKRPLWRVVHLAEEGEP